MAVIYKKRIMRPLAILLIVTMLSTTIAMAAGGGSSSPPGGLEFSSLTRVLQGWRLDLKDLETALDREDWSAIPALARRLADGQDGVNRAIDAFRPAVAGKYQELVGRYDGFRKAFHAAGDDCLSLLRRLNDHVKDPDKAACRSLKSELKKVLKKSKYRWLGTDLSHRSLGDTVTMSTAIVSPSLPPGITETEPGEADLALTGETAATPALRAKVRELGRDPVRIYEFVRNKIEFEPYFGSRKGADKTLADLAGNDLDQAALLTALLRIAGVPSRFALGRVRLGMDQAEKWLGARSPNAALAMLQKNGIPASPLTAAGVYVGVEFDHAWVRAYLHVFPDRAGREDTSEEVWLDLDPSYKNMQLLPRQDLTAVVGVDPRALLADARAQTTCDAQAGSATGVPETLLLGKIAEWGQAIRRYADANQLGPADLGQRVRIVQSALGILPLSQPWTECESRVYAEVPAVMRHSLSVALAGVNGGGAATVTIPLVDLGGRSLNLTAKPATAADVQALADLAQSESLPAYLIDVVPEISLGNDVILRGGETGLGQTCRLEIGFIGPTTGAQRSSHVFTAGSAAAIIVDAGGITLRDCLRPLPGLRGARSKLDDGGVLATREGVSAVLDTIGRSYFHQLNELNDLAAAALDVRVVRHPSVLLATYELTSEEVYGIPFAAWASGFSIDVETDLISPVSRNGSLVREKQFLAVSGLTASALEHDLLAGVLGGAGVSTVRAIQVANRLKVPIYTIKPERAEAAINALSPPVRESAAETIRDAAAAGYWTIIPRDETEYAGWKGVGCIVLDPYTNAASYLISGGLQGGMTNVSPAPPAAMLTDSRAAGLRELIEKALGWDSVLQTTADEIRWSYLPAVASVSDWLQEARNLDEVTTIAAAIVISGPIDKVCETMSVVNVRCYPELFSPNGDGAADTVLLTADLTREGSWQVLVRNAAGAPLKTYEGRGQHVTLDWSGETDTGPITASGEYTLQVTARDSVTGQEAASPLVLVNVDLDPPAAAITEPAAGASLRGVVRVLGTANDLHFSRFNLEYALDNGGGAWQTLAANTQPVIDNVMHFWDTTSLPNGPYTLRLAVHDTAGNVSIQTRTCMIDNPVTDETPPVCRLLKPSEGETLSGRVELLAEAGDDTGVAGVRFLVDGKAAGEEVTLAPYAVSIETAKYAVGEHTIIARARDLAGNTADSAPVRAVFGGAIHNFSVTPNPFSPNNDGRNDTVAITAALASEASWTVDIVENGGDGGIEASKTGMGTAVNWVWDGRSTGGSPLPSGAYLIRLTVGPETAGELLYLNAEGEAPIAEITAPADGAEVGGAVKITGTAADADFSHYELKYRRQGASAWTTLVDSQTPVINGLLGQLDGTLLGNDFYEIQLVTWDRAGSGMADTVTVALTGAFKIGNFAFTLLDMQVNVGDLPVALIRSYDTLDRDLPSDFGYGWKFTLSTVNLKEDPYHSIMVTLPDGRRTRFAFAPNFPAISVQQTLAYPRYIQATGFPDKLSCLDVPVVIFMDGEYYVPGELGGVDVYRPQRFKLEAADGNVYYIDRDLGVTKMVDRNGQTVEITPTGVRHSSGAEIRIMRDGGGRITRATDPTGAFVTYEYDAQGDLVAATDLAGRRVTYTYTGHAMTGIFDTDGKPILANEYDQSGRVKAIKDPAGKPVQINYDLAARKETVTDRNGNPTVYGYDASGNVVAKTDALGNTWAYAYDNAGRKLMETDPLGRTTYWTYASNGEIASVTDPAGNVTGNTWSSVLSPASTGFIMLLTSTKDALGRVTSYGYDARGNLTSLRDPLGNSTKLAVDGAGQLVSYTDPLGGSYQFAYTNGQPTRTTDPLGNVTDMTYDAAGRVLTETRRVGSGGVEESVTTRYEYDAAGRVTKIIHPDGNEEITEYNGKGQVTAKVTAGRRTSYEYDGLGQLWKTTYPDGTYEESNYDANGNRISQRGTDGQITTYIYDAVDRLVKTIYPDGSCTETRYDAAGQVSEEIDVRGGSTRYEYDESGRQIRAIDPLGHETRYTYDLAGNQTAVMDMRGTATSYEYDACNRLVRTLLPDGSRITYEYDALGRRVGQIDQLLNKTGYAYDALGRLMSVTDALGNVTRYEYDESGRMTAQTDANGHTTRFLYDVMGRLLEKILPLGQKEICEYYPDGMLKTKTDPNGVKTVFTYDPVTARLMNKVYSTGDRVDYTYYPDGRLKTAADTGGTISYEYDIMGRLSRLCTPAGKIIAYEYDRAGNRTKIVAPHGVIQYGYDLFGRIETVTDQAGRVSRYTYDDLGRQAKATYGNGTETVYGFDVLNRLTSVVNRKTNGQILTSHEYTLNAVGHRTEIREQGSTVRYVYDKLYRLVEEHRAGDLVYDAVYTYDAAGNRLTKTATDGSFTYAYDDNDRLLSDGKYTYAWDEAGRMTGRTGAEGTTTYVYNAEDRLLEADGPEGRVTFTYDPAGNRTGRTTAAGTTSWLVDPNMPYAQVLEETTGTATKVYAYGNDLLNMDGPDGTRWFAYDGLGSTRALTDENGTLTDAYAYEAFGSLARRTGTTGNEFLFTGEQWEPGLGTYYLRARYYDLVVGRFSQRDLYPVNYIRSITLNGYNYCENNPINYIDPSGFVTLVEGNAAHRQIEDMYWLEHIDDFPLIDTMIRIILNKEGFIGELLRPDIANPNPLRREVYEIKPEGSEKAGEAQLWVYLVIMNLFSTHKWHVGKQWPTAEIRRPFILNPLRTLVVNPSVKGVITYRITNNPVSNRYQRIAEYSAISYMILLTMITFAVSRTARGIPI